MATTSKYIVLSSLGANFIDLKFKAGPLSFYGQEIVFAGSNSLDSVFVRPGITFDFTSSKGTQDKIYLEGLWSDYYNFIGLEKITGVMTLNRTVDGSSENVRFVKSSTASDVLVFRNGLVNSLDIYNALNSTTPSQSLQNLVPSSSETSQAPNIPAVQNAVIKALAFDANGEVFKGFGGGGPKLIVSGSNGIDTVYVQEGSQVDATALKGGKDIIYFKGAWESYSKSVDALTGNITFARSVVVDGVSQNEQVVVSGGSTVATKDQLTFANGTVQTDYAKTAIVNNANALLSAVQYFDASITTPGLAPVLSTSLDSSHPLDVSSNLVLSVGESVAGVAGKKITITDLGGAHYRGENVEHSFSLDAAGPNVKVTGSGAATKIIIDPSSLFDLDLSSNYSLSIDVGAFVSVGSAQTTAAFTTVNFSTVTPATGLAAAQLAYRMDETTGSLVAANKWVDIEGQGIGSTAEVSSSPSVVVMDAANGNYSFVIKDSSSAGGDPNVGAGIEASTDFAVLLKNFGSSDRVYIDDAFNDASKLNDPTLEVFSQGNGSAGVGALTWRPYYGGGDPALFIELENGVIAPSSALSSVNSALGLATGESIIIGDGMNGSTSAPSAPTITSIGGLDSIVSGQSGDNVIAGKAKAASIVTIKVGASVLGTATANASGDFSYVLTEANIGTLGQGSSKTVTATATDVAGNAGASATSSSFSVDTAAPSAPTITSIGGSDSIVSGQSGDNVVVGKAEAGSTVTIKLGNSVLGEAATNASGDFTYTLTEANIASFGQGTAKTTTATATDAAGNVSQVTTSSSFSVDTAAPSAPTITSIGGSDSTVSGQSGDNVVVGKAEAGSTVTIKVGQTALGTATTNASGDFSYTLTTANIATLGQGSSKTVTATATDVAGNLGASATSSSFAVNTSGSSSYATTVSLVDLRVEAAETNSGLTTFNFTVNRTGDLSLTGNVNWSVVGSGSAPADAADFSAGVLPSGGLNFAAFESKKTIVVSVAGDTVAEPFESFNVKLSSPSTGVGLGVSSADGIIANDDAGGGVITTPVAVAFNGVLPNGPELIQFKNTTRYANGHVTVDVYAYLGTAIDSCDVTLNVSGVSYPYFTSALNGWTALGSEPSANPTQFLISAFPNSATATVGPGNIKIGTLDFNGATSGVHIEVSSSSSFTLSTLSLETFATSYAIDFGSVSNTQNIAGSINNDLLAAVGYTSPVTISASSGSDFIIVEGSNITATGGAGADTYQIGNASTKLVVTDFDATADRFDFSNISGTTSNTMSDMLMAAVETTSGSSYKTVLSLDLLDGINGNAQGSIELAGVHKNDLSTSLFLTNLDHSLLNQFELIAGY